MKKLTIYTILLTFSVSVSNADESVALNKGQPAPFSGVLLSEPKAQEIRLQLLDYDDTKKIITLQRANLKLYEDNQKIYNDKVNILLEHNDKLAKTLRDARETSQWERIGWFALGVLATGLAAYGTRKALE